VLTVPKDILEQFPIRKNKKQKQDFRDSVQTYVQKLGYDCVTEEGSFGVRNLVMGDPEKAKYIVSAHYDTCARMMIPNLVTPCNLLFFALYQIMIIGLILVPSILAGALVGIISEKFSAVTALSVYWILLLIMIVGPANPSNVNDNSSGVITLLEIMRTLPENQRNKICFVLFDLEEAGLLGSAAYRKKHKKATDSQVVLNLDCVGDGDYLLMFPTKKLRKDKKMLTSFYKACGYFGKKSLCTHEKGWSIYPSDQANFPYGVGVAAFHKMKYVGFYYSRIHTPKDIILDETNVNILRAALTTYICCDAAQ